MKRLFTPFFILTLLLPFLIGGLPGIGLAQRAAKSKSPSVRILSKSRKLVLAKGEKRYACVFLSASSPLIVAATGPVLLKANVRLNFNMKNLMAKKTGELRIYRDQQRYSTHKLEWSPSEKVSYPESSDLLPSVATTVKIEIPPGEHRVKLSLSSELSAAVRLTKAPLAKPVKRPPAAKKRKVVHPVKPKEVKKPLVAAEKKPPVVREKEVLEKPEVRKAFQISAQLDCGYDSNIIQLSSEDRKSFDSSSDQFKIESVSDFIIIPRIDLLMKKEFLSERLTELEFDYYYSVYSSNSIKSYSNIGFSVRQQLIQDTTLSGGFYLIPSFYLRQLCVQYSEDGGECVQYKEASYRLNSFSIGLEQVFLNWLLTSLAYRWEARDYGGSFDERDQTFNIIEFSLVMKKIESLQLIVGYSYIMAPARGNLSGTPGLVEGDVSYDGQAFSFGAAYDFEDLLDKRMGLGVEAEFESRKFTTSNDEINDPIHSGRKDGLNRIVVGYYWDFLDSWTLRLDYKLTLVKTNLSADIFPDEPTDYSENLISLGITYHLPTFGPQVR